MLCCCVFVSLPASPDTAEHCPRDDTIAVDKAACMLKCWIYKGDGQEVKALMFWPARLLEKSFGEVFACSKECPGDEAQGMSHGFVAIQAQLRTTCVPTAVGSQTRLSVFVPTAVVSQMRFPTAVESRTRLSVCVPTAVESQTGSRRSSW